MKDSFGSLNTGKVVDPNKPMSTCERLGGVIHTYQKFDPAHFPSPTAPPPLSFKRKMLAGSLSSVWHSRGISHVRPTVGRISP